MIASDTKYKEEGLRLQQARKSLGLTQRELAEMIDSSLATVKSYERGVSVPNRSFAEALARLGINMGYVFANEQPVLIPKSSRAAHSEMVGRVMHQSGDSAAAMGAHKPATDRLRASTQSILQISDSIGYEPPMAWTALIQELIFSHGLSEAGARRIMETLKAERSEK